MNPPAHAPFDEWPRHLVDPRFGRAWFAAPAVFVDQTHLAHGTAVAIHALHDAIDQLLACRGPMIRAAGGLTIVHDWRTLRTYDSEARREYLERMRRRDPGYLHRAVTIVPDTPWLRMAVQTANLLMALHIGGKLEFATTPGATLRTLDLRDFDAAPWSRAAA